MTPDPGPAGDEEPRTAHGHAGSTAPDIAAVRGGRALARLTRALALVGGALLLVAVAITIVSVAGRYALGEPVPGDYELVEIICAVAIFLFFPYTHAADGNITAEFFTAGLSVRRRRALDTVHDVIFAVLAALMTLRLGHGLIDTYHSGETSLLIRIPIWWPYCFAVACMGLLTVICIWRIAANIGALRR